MYPHVLLRLRLNIASKRSTSRTAIHRGVATDAPTAAGCESWHRRVPESHSNRHAAATMASLPYSAYDTQGQYPILILRAITKSRGFSVTTRCRIEFSAGLHPRAELSQKASARATAPSRHPHDPHRGGHGALGGPCFPVLLSSFRSPANARTAVACGRLTAHGSRAGPENGCGPCQGRCMRSGRVVQAFRQHRDSEGLERAG